MKCNLGQTEKYVRLVLGLVLGAFGLYFRHNVSAALGLVVLLATVFFLFTAILNWCPITWLRTLKNNE